MKMREFDCWAGFGWKSHRRDFGYCKISHPGEKKKDKNEKTNRLVIFIRTFCHRATGQEPTGQRSIRAGRRYRTKFTRNSFKLF